MARGRVWQEFWDWLHPGQQSRRDQRPDATRETNDDGVPLPSAAARAGRILGAVKGADQAVGVDGAGVASASFAHELDAPIRRIPGTAHALTLLEGGAQAQAELESLGFEVSAAGEAVLTDRLTVLADERELLEFLAADLDPVPADPVFREQLREDLWEMVSQNAAARSDES